MKKEFKSPSPERKVYCNRTLNLKSIRAIGYDMDYTLIHYHVEEWELRAYEYLKKRFIADGWPVKDLQFQPKLVARGLTIDTQNGNLLKANRFGFIKKAMHGTSPIGFEEQRDLYARTLIDLADERWVFLNTLFSLSEGCMYAQLVDLLDQRKIPEVLGYPDLYKRVKGILDAAHMEGQLKADIIADPEKYVILEKETATALWDQHVSGKKLILITNSEWHYTIHMMAYCFDRFLPAGKTWKDLFDLVIIGARKPYFFTTQQPFFEVVTDEGLLKTHSGKLEKSKIYLGGSAREVEKTLNLSGDEILYVGDHMFGDVHVSKNVLRWRTALVLRELEDELDAIEKFKPSQKKLMALMEKKEHLEEKYCLTKLEQQRHKKTDHDTELQKIRNELSELDKDIAPLAKMDTESNNPIWGLLMRAGNDKSYLAYQIERYADIYTSRVSNFLWITPFAYLRSPRGSLPHDPGYPV